MKEAAVNGAKKTAMCSCLAKLLLLVGKPCKFSYLYVKVGRTIYEVKRVH
jgi:hypothetical protein